MKKQKKKQYYTHINAQSNANRCICYYYLFSVVITLNTDGTGWWMRCEEKCVCSCFVPHERLR